MPESIVEPPYVGAPAMQRHTCRSPNAIVHRACIVLAVLVLGLVHQSAHAADAGRTLEGTVALGGSVKETIRGDPEGINDYEGDYKVTITYKIKVDGTGKFVPDDSTVTFHDPKYDFTTKEIKLKNIKGDPAAGTVDSFEFDVTDWDNAPKAGAVNNGFKGSVTVNKGDRTKGKGTIKASYKIGDRVVDYVFDSDVKAPDKPRKRRRGRHPVAETNIEDDESLDYDALSRMLSILADTIVKTPSASDPILGAALNFPIFEFDGFSQDGKLAIFWPAVSDMFTITSGGDVYAQSRIPVLYYDMHRDFFYATLREMTFAGMAPSSPFYDPDLSSTPSEFLDSLDRFLSPLSPDFNPSLNLYLTIFPDTNYNLLTDSFELSAKTGGIDLHFPARSAPEPSSLAILLAGWAVLAAAAWRRVRKDNLKLLVPAA